MNGLALVGHQFRYDQKAFWRNPASVFFTVMFPVIVFLILAVVFNGETVKVRIALQSREGTAVVMHPRFAREISLRRVAG